MRQTGKEKSIVVTISLIAGSLMIEGLILIALHVLFRQIMSDIINVLTIIISTTIASLIYPYVLLKKTYRISFSDVGIRMPNTLTIVIVLLSGIYIASLFAKKGVSHSILLIAIQNLFVAIGEEFVARGCLYYLLRKVFKNELSVIMLSTLIFVFLFHSNSTLIDNLIWRLPITILLSYLYSKSNVLYNTIVIHMVYNISVSI